MHSRYQRRLADLPVGGRLVELCLTVRRFLCVNTVCGTRTFAEQVAGLTRRRARRSEPLRTMLTSIGLALASRAGVRLAAKVGIRTSRNSLLRLVRAVPDPAVGSVRVLGVDDIAVKRGHHGTVLIDCENRRVVDLVPGRDASPLAQWLLQHESPAVICRDRASSYAEGARTGAPDAVQVADRFHLLQNLATAVERLVAKHKGCLIEHPTAPAADATGRRRGAARRDGATPPGPPCPGPQDTRARSRVSGRSPGIWAGTTEPSPNMPTPRRGRN